MNTSKVLLLAFGVLGLSAISAHSGEPIGVVTDLRGAVGRTASDKSELLVVGSAIYELDMISTEPRGFVSIKLQNEGTLTLGPDTSAIMDAFITKQVNDLEVTSGPLNFDEEDQHSPESEAVRTVFGMIGVRG